MEICCVSDLHGYFPDVGSGDLLIICGDLTARDINKDWVDFEVWVTAQCYKSIIIVSGNHDNFLASTDEHRMWKFWDKADCRIHYLCDSGTEFEGLKIWGSPWTKTFEGMNPRCKAFTVDTEEELAEKWALIPDDVDILITHSPPHGILDKNIKGNSCGSTSLTNNILRSTRRQLHVFGHLHESYGIEENRWGGYSVNASHVNERYEPVNKPVKVVL